MNIYIVIQIEDNKYGPRNSDVLSVWSEKEDAQKEIDRLSVGREGYLFTIEELELDKPW